MVFWKLMGYWWDIPSGYVKIAIETMAQSKKNLVSFPIKIAWWIFPVRFSVHVHWRLISTVWVSKKNTEINGLGFKPLTYDLLDASTSFGTAPNFFVLSEHFVEKKKQHPDFSPVPQKKASRSSRSKSLSVPSMVCKVVPSSSCTWVYDSVTYRYF